MSSNGYWNTSYWNIFLEYLLRLNTFLTEIYNLQRRICFTKMSYSYIMFKNKPKYKLYKFFFNPTRPHSRSNRFILFRNYKENSECYSLENIYSNWRAKKNTHMRWPNATRSLSKGNFISKCLVLWCCTGLEAKYMTLTLSWKTIVALDLQCNSRKRLWSQGTSTTTFVTPLYSASTI